MNMLFFRRYFFSQIHIKYYCNGKSYISCANYLDIWTERTIMGVDDKIGMNVDGVAQMGDTEKDSSERVKDVVPTTRT